jgi:hypothetical protein
MVLPSDETRVNSRARTKQVKNRHDLKEYASRVRPVRDRLEKLGLSREAGGASGNILSPKLPSRHSVRVRIDLVADHA